jgi:hypothetical protein
MLSVHCRRSRRRSCTGLCLPRLFPLHRYRLVQHYRMEDTCTQRQRSLHNLNPISRSPPRQPRYPQNRHPRLIHIPLTGLCHRVRRTPSRDPHPPLARYQSCLPCLPCLPCHPCHHLCQGGGPCPPCLRYPQRLQYRQRLRYRPRPEVPQCRRPLRGSGGATARAGCRRSARLEPPRRRTLPRRRRRTTGSHMIDVSPHGEGHGGKGSE